MYYVSITRLYKGRLYVLIGEIMSMFRFADDIPVITESKENLKENLLEIEQKFFLMQHVNK